MDDQLGRQRELERRLDALERRVAADERPSRGAADAAQTAFWAMMHRIFPDEARRHMKAATREQLLAARTYLDRWITGLEEREQAEAAERTHERIEVE